MDDSRLPSWESRVLPSAAPSIHEARRWVRRQAKEAFPDPMRVFDVELATSELVTNAVEHAVGDTIEIGVGVQPTWFTVEVASRSSGVTLHIPNEVTVAPDQLSGRGLGIVASVSDAVTVRQRPPLTAVRCWFARESGAE